MSAPVQLEESASVLRMIPGATYEPCHRTLVGADHRIHRYGLDGGIARHDIDVVKMDPRVEAANHAS